jgi:6-phosphogluconolactonase
MRTALTLLTICLLIVRAGQPCLAVDPPYFVYVSGTIAGGGAQNIACFNFDPVTATLTAASTSAGGNDPWYLAWSPDRTHVYAINSSVAGITGGRIASFSVDAATGALTRLNDVSSGGDGPAHLSMHPSGKWVFAANYTSGHIASIPVLADGSLGAPVSVLLAGIKAHMVLPNAAGTRLYVPCLGSDYVAIYQINAATGALTANAPATVALPAGSGPRHMAFSSDETHAYVICEVGSTMTSFAHDPATGAMTGPVTLSTLPAGYVGTNTAAHVLVSKDDLTLYGSNRGHNSIVSYRIAPTTGALTPLADDTAGGEIMQPRDLLVASVDAKLVTVFRVAATTGLLTRLGKVDVASGPDFVGVMPKASVLTTLSVAPVTRTLAIGATQGFSVQGLDQFGTAMAGPPPAVTWSLTGPGTITAAGIYTATAHGTATVHASDGTHSASATITVANAAPTVAAAAQAAPAPVTGLSAALSVLGADDLGEGALTYAWSVVGTPPAPVGFSQSGTHAARAATVTFAAAGSYQLRATITDGDGATVSSTATVTVAQTFSAIRVDPTAPALVIGADQQFTAIRRDQFGADMAATSSSTWAVTAGGGTITPSGLFTAPATAGSSTVTATDGVQSASATIAVVAAAGAGPGGGGGGSGGGGGGGCGLGGGIAALVLAVLALLRALDAVAPRSLRSQPKNRP